jgi:hypothetical protein
VGLGQVLPQAQVASYQKTKAMVDTLYGLREM